MGRPFEQIENLVGYHRHMTGALIAERTLRSAMTMVVAAEALPLAADTAGVFRVGNSRVTLDTVVGAICDGTTAEEVAEQYRAARSARFMPPWPSTWSIPPRWSTTSTPVSSARPRWWRRTSGSSLPPGTERA
jgi:hypothetical protein